MPLMTKRHQLMGPRLSLARVSPSVSNFYSCLGVKKWQPERRILNDCAVGQPCRTKFTQLNGNDVCAYLGSES